MISSKLALAASLSAALGLSGAAVAQTAEQSTQPGQPAPPMVQPAPGAGDPGAAAQDPAAPGGGLMEREEDATGATAPQAPVIGGGNEAQDDTTPPAATMQHTEPRTGAAPVPGANSFTEGQARARMEDAGFGDLTDLRLDDEGIWRARGTRDGQQVGVALDYQGNVVAQPQQ